MSDVAKTNKYLGSTRGASSGTTSATVQLVVPADQFFQGYITFGGTVAASLGMNGTAQLSGSIYAYANGTFNATGGAAFLAAQTSLLTLGPGTYDLATAATITNSAIVIYQGAFYAKD